MNISDFEHVKKFKFLPTDEGTMDVRFRELEWLSKFISSEGLNLEFGVHSGQTINCIAKARPDLTFYGFDSFEGLPEDWDTGTKYVKKEAFDRSGEPPEVEDNVKLVKGFFDESIPKWLEENNFDRRKTISYLHIDSDLFSSATTIFTELNDMITAGTIIRFDELCCWRYAFNEATPQRVSRVYYTTWKEHEWRALIEWMTKYNRNVVPLCRNWFQGGTVVVTQ